MIGVFDSGFGGLAILRALGQELPAYDYVYLGDNARAPYGNKSEEVIFSYTRAAVARLFAEGCPLVILACNTASAKALRRIQQEYLPTRFPDRRVLGVLIPVAQEAARLTRCGRVGVIGTRATMLSGAYERELKKIAPNLEIYNQACPLLVPLVEEGWVQRPETKMVLRKYLRPLKAKRIDTLIPGCTHYSFLRREMARIMGRSARVLDAPRIVAVKLADYLARHPEIEGRLVRQGRRRYLTTEDTAFFRAWGEKYAGERMEEVARVRLDDPAGPDKLDNRSDID